MNAVQAWQKYCLSLSLDELDMQKTQLELELQGNGEMAESKRLGYLPFGAEVEDYEHEAKEAAWRLEIVEKFIQLHTWAETKVGTKLGEFLILGYSCKETGTGAYFNCSGKEKPVYQLVPKE